MDRVVLNIEIQGESRPTEIIADLRTVAETLFYPMKLVGFWDTVKDMHLCPQEERRQKCPHKLPAADTAFVEYTKTLQRERRANIEVVFPHAGITIYLS
ncbi:MAG: hypothetical protein FJ317_04870 [SAR202 cluster bacterium]|nr:hypothetical protein [SAR202 cluster bacterium]